MRHQQTCQDDRAQEAQSSIGYSQTGYPISASDNFCAQFAGHSGNINIRGENRWIMFELRCHTMSLGMGILFASMVGIMNTMAVTNQKGSMMRTMIKVLAPMQWVSKAKNPVK